jgi:hypothetical protein
VAAGILSYEPTEADLGLMIKGTKLAAGIHFASEALRVMPMTFRSPSYTSLGQVDELDEIVHDNTDIGCTPRIRRAVTQSAATRQRV